MKLRIRFKSGEIRQPIIAETVLKTGAKIEIELAKVEGSTGEIVMNVPEESCRSVVEFLKSKNVDVTRVGETIVKDEESCVHCGACVSICPVSAISYEHDWRVKLDKSQCVQCGTCVNACPLSVIRLTDES